MNELDNDENIFPPDLEPDPEDQIPEELKAYFKATKKMLEGFYPPSMPIGLGFPARPEYQFKVVLINEIGIERFENHLNNGWSLGGLGPSAIPMGDRILFILSREKEPTETDLQRLQKLIDHEIESATNEPNATGDYADGWIDALKRLKVKLEV